MTGSANGGGFAEGAVSAEAREALLDVQALLATAADCDDASDRLVTRAGAAELAEEREVCASMSVEYALRARRTVRIAARMVATLLEAPPAAPSAPLNADGAGACGDSIETVDSAADGGDAKTTGQTTVMVECVGGPHAGWTGALSPDQTLWFAEAVGVPGPDGPRTRYLMRIAAAGDLPTFPLGAKSMGFYERREHLAYWRPLPMSTLQAEA